MQIKYKVVKTETKEINFDIEEYINGYERNEDVETYEQAFERLKYEGFDHDRLLDYVYDYADSEFVYDTFADEEDYREVLASILVFFCDCLFDNGISVKD